MVIWTGLLSVVHCLGWELTDLLYVENEVFPVQKKLFFHAFNGEIHWFSLITGFLSST